VDKMHLGGQQPKGGYTNSPPSALILYLKELEQRGSFVFVVIMNGVNLTCP